MKQTKRPKPAKPKDQVKDLFSKKAKTEKDLEKKIKKNVNRHYLGDKE